MTNTNSTTVRADISKRVVSGFQNIMTQQRNGEIDVIVAAKMIHSLYDVVFPFITPDIDKTLMPIVNTYESEMAQRRKSVNTEFSSDDSW
jgi:hypothetical protein